MIKRILLNQKAKPKGKVKEHGTYKEAKSIGILYNVDQYDTNVINDLILTFETDGKSVTKLGYLEKMAKPELTQHFIFSKKDISTTGALKKESISLFIRQSFDFLISLDTAQNINYKYILACSKAICKIGVETESYRDLLTLSLKPSDQSIDSARSVVKYLKMI